MSQQAKRKSVFILCTGGTIAMRKTTSGYAPAPGYLTQSMPKLQELANPDMPLYTVEEYEAPMDSASMTPEQWVKMASIIVEKYNDYDGFVILHGTDTMAYTASALSFMLENLSKPVILTGSQLPLFETRSDARENLINAIYIASRYHIPEVCVYFHNKLFRGNRCKKTDASSFDAFSSPNFPMLGKVGTDVAVRHSLVNGMPTAALHLQKMAAISVGVVRLFPGMNMDILKLMLRPPLQALILETYGLGNAPERADFLDPIREAVDSGIVIVNCSQCTTAKIKMHEYATGTALLKAGVVSGGDMLVEAALAKLFYLFSKNVSLPQIKEMLSQNLRGELTL